MIDREKVLDALRNCINKPKCRDCPWEECELDHETFTLPKGLVMDMFDLLKDLEPVKPRSISRHGAYPQIQHFCGNCNAKLFHKKQKYCAECGRMVKWE